jgi:signal recognition particle subunit SRP54
MADQILGLGDVLTLAEKAVDKIDQTSTKKSFSRMLAGKFDLEDLLRQMEQINKLGSLGGIMKMMPSSITSQINDDQIEDVENKIRI